MRAILERTGGFAGIKRTSVADTDELSEAAAQKLLKLIEGAEFFTLPETIISKSMQPDRFEYTLTVEDGERTHTVTVGESAQPDSLRVLTEFLVHPTSK